MNESYTGCVNTLMPHDMGRLQSQIVYNIDLHFTNITGSFRVPKLYNRLRVMSEYIIQVIIVHY